MAWSRERHIPWGLPNLKPCAFPSPPPQPVTRASIPCPLLTLSRDFTVSREVTFHLWMSSGVTQRKKYLRCWIRDSGYPCG